jgi:hypothetical protein
MQSWQLMKNVPDFGLPPAPAVKVQLAALKAAFPAYVVNVIKYRGEKPLFEAVAKDTGRDLYCVISDDAREIWRELRAAA